MQAMTTVEGAARRQDVPALTGLRFVAAFSVLFAHGLGATLANDQPPQGAVLWLMSASGFGMTLFFVLSGFVIHYNYATLVTNGGLRGIAAFMWARFARLYPLFLLMMLVYVLVSQRQVAYWTGHRDALDPLLEALPYFLLSIQSWIYKIIGGGVLIDAIRGGSPPTWSISTEWFFYFAYPALAWLVLRARSVSVIVLAVCLWCVVWGAFATVLYDRAPQIDAWAVAHFGAVASAQDLENSFVRWLLYISPYLRIGEFVLGVIVAQFYVVLRSRNIPAWEHALGGAAFLAAAASVVLVTYLEYSPDVPVNVFRRMSMNFALAPSVALLIFCAARYRSAASRLLTSRPAVGLGEASYSIYLVHSIVLISAVKLTAGAVHGVAYNIVKLIVLMAIVVAISLVLYAYYEAPARRLLRQRWRKRSMPTAFADAAQSSAT
ncbi:MAG TPA: acyltransferase [Xanthobacteraceae bacterium]|nr:acyltransferase [Xanthobacteraceae bacterium]